MNKATFLSKGLKPRKVMIPSIETEVHVLPMSYAAAMAMGQVENNAERALVAVVFGLVDTKGKAIFTLEDKEELATSMTYLTIQEIAAEIMNISSIGSDSLVK